MLDTYYRLKAKFAIYVWKYVLDSFGYIFVLVIVVYASIFLVTKTSNKKTAGGVLGLESIIPKNFPYNRSPIFLKLKEK